MCDINHWSWHDFFKVTIDPAPVWRVTYKWVMSQLCHICKWVMSHMNEACQIWIRWMKESFHTWRSHVTHTDAFICSRSTHMNQSCHTNQPTMLHIWIRHITQALIDISYQPRACGMWRQSGPVLFDLCYVSKWVMSHVNESCHTHRACVMWPVLCDDMSIRACVMWRQSGPVLCDVNQGLCYVTCLMWRYVNQGLCYVACRMWVNESCHM